MYERSIADPTGFWGEAARSNLTWFRDFKEVTAGGFKEMDLRWFTEGQLNVCYNCVDRWIPERGDQVAIIFEADEIGAHRTFTYRQVLAEVCKTANVFLAQGVRRGDTVAVYMPMSPELAFVMLACARIGAVHSVVFAGFSAESLRDRILDGQSKWVVTANEGMRGGRAIPLKSTVDNAVSQSPCVKNVFVYRHTAKDVVMGTHDIDMSVVLPLARPYCPAVSMDSEEYLFLLYTSGSTGKPKGVAHTTAGYLLYAAMTHKYVFDIRPGDVYACVADAGWITGHTYIIYGPLANGTTTVMFESTPLYPNASRCVKQKAPGKRTPPHRLSARAVITYLPLLLLLQHLHTHHIFRYWDLVERHKVTQFYTAPTAIRTLMKFGDDPVKAHNLSTLRVLGSVGEPINPEAWRWYSDVVGAGKCSVVDTYWQTETGGHMITPLPGAIAAKPGSATLPFFGIEIALLDKNGLELSGNNVSGMVCVKRPWPAMARTIYGDHARFLDVYTRPFPGYYFTGDGGVRDKDGYLWITGRVDDVLNVSGHRLGSAEIESALVANSKVAEAAVIGFPHDTKGEGICCYVTLKAGVPESPEVSLELKNQVRKVIGPFATPDLIVLTSGLPKTRSGKIMRRILRKIVARQSDQLGDVSSLAEPSIVTELIEKVNALLDGK